MQAGSYMNRSIVSLLIGWLVFSSSATMVSAFSQLQAEVVVTNIQDQRIAYVDQRDRTVYYVVQPTGQKRSYVVERAPDGTLMKWDDRFESLDSVNGELPEVTFHNPIHAQEHCYYNVEDDKVHQGLNFELSPDGQWGMTKIMTNRVDPEPRSGQPYQLIKSYLLKNNNTGTISEWFESTTTNPVYWMADSKLLLERYSDTAKQNEIIIYDIEQDQYEFVMNASLEHYDPKTNQMHYTNNEPERKEWVYDFNTKQYGQLAGDQENNRLIEQHLLASDSIPMLDATLNLSQLPSKSIATVRDSSTTLHIDGQEIAVESVVERNGIQWIPARPLIEALSWGMELLSEKAVDGYRYKLSVGQNEVELNYRNSLMYKQRVFMTLDQLQALGYSEVTVDYGVEPDEM